MTKHEAANATMRDASWFRLLSAHLPDVAVFTLDAAGRVSAWSPMAKQLFGYDESESLEKPFEQLCSVADESPENGGGADDRSGDLRGFLEQVDAEGEAAFDCWANRKEGPRFWSRWRLARPQPVDDFPSDGFVCTVRDCTRERETKDSLRRAEIRFRSVVQSNMIGIGFWDADGYVTDANDLLLDMIGYDRGAIERREVRWTDLTPPEFRDADRKALSETQLEGSCKPYEKEWYRRDGTRFPILIGGSHDEGDPHHGSFWVLDISDRKQAEQQLQLQAKVLESMVEGATISDEHGVILYANPAQERLFGYEPGELAGEQVSLVQQTTASAPGAPIELQSHVQRHGLWRGEFRNRKKDGTPFTTSARISSLEWGGRQYYVCVQEDITERKRAEEALAESELRFRQLAEHINAVFWMADPVKPEMLYISPAYEQIWGRTRQSLFEQPRSFLDAVHEEDRPRVIATLQAQAQGETTAEEYRVVQPDGTVRWVWDRGFPIKNAAGEVYRVAGIAEDITERKLADQSLRESEARLRRIVESNVIGLIVGDSSGHILEANDAFLEMVGYDADDLRAGRLNFLSLTPPEYRHLDQHAVAELRETGHHTPFEKEFVRKDGCRVPVMVGTAYLGRDRDGRELGVGFLLDLTATKLAEQALRQSERFRSLMEQAPFSIQLFDPSGRPIQVNRAWEELWGARLEQIQGYNVLQDPQLEAKGIQSYLQRAFDGEPTQVPAIQYDPNETIPDHSSHSDPRRWVSAVAYPLKDSEGHVREVVVVHEDITARKRAEDALRDSEERFRSIVSHSVAGVAEVDLEGRFVFANERYCEIVGRPLETLLTLSMQEISHQDDLVHNLPLFEQIAKDGKPYIIEKRYLRPDGSEVWVNNSVSGLRGPNGQIKSVVAVCVDISDRQMAERALREAHRDLEQRIAERTSELTRTNRFLRALLESMHDGIVACDVEGNLTVFNRAATEIHGLPAESVPSSEWAEHYDLYYADGETPMATEDIPLVRALAGEPVKNEEMVIAPAGQLPRDLLASGQAFFDDQGNKLGAVVSMHDITDRKLAEQALRVAHEELERRVAERTQELAEANEALQEADRRKDDFLAMLAHELRNPLAPIRTGLDLLALDANPAHPETVQLMQRQIEHVVRLVDDLLDVSRIMRGKVVLRREEIELAELFKRSADAVRPQLNARKQRLSVTLPDQPIWFHADPVRMVQIIENLLNNASKYTDEGGRIELKAEQEGKEVVITVRDNGIGIEATLLPKVFELFTQSTRSLDRAQGGLGIGLTLVQRLVTLHEGSISAASDGPGAGSSFTVRLPALASLSREPSPDTAAAAARPRTILVVDDNVGAAKMLSLLLKKLNHHRVETVHDGAAALETIEALRPEIVLLDIGLPGMDGYEVARAVRQSEQNDPLLLVALTGYGQEEDRRRSREAGFDEHLVKPPSIDQIRAVLSHPKLQS